MGNSLQQTPAADTQLAEEIEQFDAIIIGAGVTGLYQLYRLRQLGLSVRSSGPHHQDSGEAKIRESTAGVSRKPSSDGKARGSSSKHLCGLTAWNT